MVADIVDSYADLAIERWAQEAVLQLGSRAGRFRRHHDPRSCACLTCADGRAALDLIPLKPLCAWRSWPEVTP